MFAVRTTLFVLAFAFFLLLAGHAQELKDTNPTIAKFSLLAEEEDSATPAAPRNPAEEINELPPPTLTTGFLPTSQPNASASAASKCSPTRWEGFTSGLLCQNGVNGRCVYRVPIGRALTLGANTFSVAFANGHSATVYAPNGQPEPVPRRHTTTLTAERSTYVYQSDADHSAFAKATRPLVRLFGQIRRALSGASNDDDAVDQTSWKDNGAIGRFKRFDRKQTEASTAVAVAGSVPHSFFDEEAEGGRREHSMRLLLSEGVIEVEDVTEGWRTAGASKPDQCRCDRCACILGLSVRGWRC